MAAGFSKVTVIKLFSFLERTVQHKVNAVGIYVYSADGSALTTFKKPEKWYGQMNIAKFS